MTETTWCTWKTATRGANSLADYIAIHLRGLTQNYDLEAIHTDMVAAINEMLSYSNARTDGVTFYGPDDDTPQWEREEIAEQAIIAARLHTIVDRHRKV